MTEAVQPRTSPLSKAGNVYKGFVVDRRQEIPEICCTLVELTHTATGARVVQLETDDEENSFCISLRTLPETSDGVAHILEHTVLCGSEKYPVKDPFFTMQRRSLNTFMNALTWPDFTCYPASSQVKADFYNLLSVYLDAVFHPTLLEQSFRQEGHRLEFQTLDDPSTPLEFHGIVFNEMKGAMASANSRLSEAIHRELFPDLTYGINSGGDPAVIPELTYEHLKSFHQRFYHPSRALFLFYGNLPLTEHLDFLLENTLKDVQKLDPIPLLPRQKRHAVPITIDEPYPCTKEEATETANWISFSWLTCPVTDQLEVLALMVLQVVLMGNDAAPLKRALLESELCTQAVMSLDEEMSEVPASIVLKGCKRDSADALQTVLLDTLKEIADKGIESDRIDSALHQLELHKSEITGDHYPHGLLLLWRATPLLNNGGDAREGLIIHEMFEKLRSQIKSNPAYLSDLIRTHFIDNSHRVRAVLYPDPELAAREEQIERKRLDTLLEAFDDTAKQEIVKNAQELERFQEEQEDQDIECLPCVHTSDIPAKTKEYPLTHHQVSGLDLYHHDCFTNGLVYATVHYPLGALSKEELPLARLFTLLAGQVGCADRDYIQNLEYIQEHTGGVGIGLDINTHADDRTQYTPLLHLTGKALYRNSQYLFPLLVDMAKQLNFHNPERLKELVLKQYTALQSSINSRGMQYALNISSSAQSVQGSIGRLWSGLEYYYFIRDLAENFDTRAEGLIQTMDGFKQRLLDLQGAEVVISCSGEHLEQLIQKDLYGLPSCSTHPSATWSDPVAPFEIHNQGRIIGSPVAFNAKVVPTISYTHEASPAMALAGFIFENNTLHPRIREQGGAYGSHSSYSPISGVFSFSSYRDPNIATTLKAFEEAIQEVVSGDFTERDLEEAKLEKIQGLDAPSSPGSRAEMEYGWIKSKMPVELRQKYRERLLATTREQVVQAVTEHLLPRMDEGRLVSFAGKELLEQENAAMKAEGREGFEIMGI